MGTRVGEVLQPPPPPVLTGKPGVYSGLSLALLPGQGLYQVSSVLCIRSKIYPGVLRAVEKPSPLPMS